MIRGFWYSSPTLRQNSPSCRMRSASRRYCSRSCLVYLPPSPSFSSDFSSASLRGGRSGSSTCSLVLERSWFWSRRGVSGASSTSAWPRSVTNPATSTRRNALTSIFDCRGVSTGISTKLAQAARLAPATARISGRRPLRLFLGFSVSLVIGFPEEVVVLLDVDVARLQLERLLVRRPRVFERPLLLEGDGEVVQGLRVVGGEGHRLPAAEPHLAPEALA